MALTKISTPGIKDEAITLAKLLHGDSNSNGKFLRANNGADPTFETVNTDLISDTSPQLGGDLDTNSHHILLDDDHNIKLGNDIDFEIFHQSSTNLNLINSHVPLKLMSNGNTEIRTNNNHSMIHCVKYGAVELYYNNVKAFQTTATGVAVIDDDTNVNIQLEDTSGITGYVYGAGTNFGLLDKSGNWKVKLFENAQVELYNHTSLRLFTRSNGATIQGGSSNVSLDFRTDTTHRGSVYANSNNSIGFLDTGGSWAIKHTNDSQTEFFIATNRKVAIDGDGLKFNNDTAAANALDDYEEGTWTPSLTNVYAAGSSSGRVCVYRKIGSMVFFTFDIFTSANNMDICTNGNTVISGLPFTPLSNFNSTMKIGIYLHNNSQQELSNYIGNSTNIVINNSRINNVRHLWGFGLYAVQ